MYTELLEDMSLGLLAGFKLATGDHTYSHFDRDTSIGTGSTDLLIGGYKLGSFPTHIGSVKLTFREKPFEWFVQAIRLSVPQHRKLCPGQGIRCCARVFLQFREGRPAQGAGSYAHALRCVSFS